jgi:3',5'-cyclic AMP phosphodiesterase CpdA
VLTRVLHVSDLHSGRGESPDAHDALRELAARLQPELLIVSGDLAHRGRRDEHERAAELLRSVGPPLLVVPGNHDIPYAFPARFMRPWAEFERLWETTEPVYRGEHLFVVGLNSVRPWRHQSGRVTTSQLALVAERFRTAPSTALRIAVLHHHVLGAPWRTRKKPVASRNVVLARLVESGAQLVLAGHIHQSTVAERREFEVSTPGGERAVVISIAPGLGRPRPHRRGEARGLHVYDATDSELTVNTYIWREDGWALTAMRTFPRGAEPLAFEERERGQAASTLLTAGARPESAHADSGRANP